MSERTHYTRTHLHAGYQLQAIREHLIERESVINWRDALQKLCVFHVETDALSGEEEGGDPILAVLQNLISRGWPTRPSCRVEEKIADAIGTTVFDDSVQAERQGHYRYVLSAEFEDEEFQAALRRAYALVDPRMSTASWTSAYESWEDHDSRAEETFHLSDVPTLVGIGGAQLLDPQRSLQSILQLSDWDREQLEQHLRNAEEGMGGNLAAAFFDQRVDFALTLPEAEGHRSNGLVIEVDGPQHQETPQQFLDRRREQECSNRGWDTLRIPTANVGGRLTEDHEEVLQEWMDHPWGRRIQKNVDEPLHTSRLGRRALQVALTPFAVARLQRVLVQLVRAGVLDVGADEWHLAVFERDVPCAHLAVEDLQEWIRTLFDLRGREAEQGVPEINLQVYGTPHFKQCALHDDHDIYTIGEEVPPSFEADVLIDISMLQRRGWSGPRNVDLNVDADHRAKIRSAHDERGKHRVATAEPIVYEGGQEQGEEEEGDEALVQLLRDVFRKRSFREGQVHLIQRTLQRRSTIALLPTGAGKSLAYQMAALLQPGVTLVVDPIKSLMRDQRINLGEEGIDAAEYINSSLSANQREERLEKLEEGRTQIVLVSPERLMIPSFRKRLSEMADRGVWFSHCVIDEAHCVSEWGHDFRTTYLRLGENARRLLDTGSDEGVPILALTGTASYDVLEDVRRELELEDLDEGGIVTPSSFRREELNFSVLPVEGPDTDEEPLEEEDETFVLREEVGERKQEVLTEAIEKLPSLFGDEDPEPFYEPRGEASNGGIVFTPHRTWLFGARDIKREISQENEYLNGRVGFYHGSDEGASQDDEMLEEYQDQFKNNELTLLAATKAFGMGIDKPNIRYTIHLNMPQSIESFYQEAGRAGRDRQPAHCVVLYCPDELIPAPDEEGKVSVDKDLMLSFHRNSFQGKEHEMRMLDNVLTSRVRLGEDEEQAPIEDQLDAMSKGQQRTVYIKFSNDRPRQLVAYLNEKLDGPTWNEGMVNEARSYESSFDSFVDNLKSEAKQRNWNEVARRLPSQLDELRKDEHARMLFETVRDQEDTLRAVHRMSLVGMVDDFILLYREDLIRAEIHKRREQDYIEKLQQYLGQYLSPEDSSQVPEEVLGKDEPTPVRRCLSRLVDFVYDRIKRKRRVAIDNMQRALDDGVEGKENFKALLDGERPEESEAGFSNRVYNFFESRFLDDMRQHLRDGYNLDLVWEYMQKTDGSETELRHLRGGCDRLLEDNPDHAAFLLLRVYAEVLLPDGSVNRARDDFKRAWDRLQSRPGKDAGHAFDKTTSILREIRSFDSTVDEELASVILPVHTERLSSMLDGPLALK